MRPKTLRRLTSFLLVIALAAAAAPAALAGHDDPAQPNDPLYEGEAPLAPVVSGDIGQWGPRQIRAEQAWHTTKGAGTTIAIVDTGVDLDHEDLRSKLVPGATFLDCGGPGSCGNGDWESGPEVHRANASTHGTHVAGIAAAATNNGIGIAGVAPDAKLMPVKVIDDATGNDSDVARGIRWAADHGADVINLSLGPEIPGTQVLTLLGDLAESQEAVIEAIAKGVVVVYSAGNQFFPLCSDQGFGTDGLCVAATDSHELRTEYTHAPLEPTMNAVSAPGGSIVDFTFTCGGGVLSTVPIGTADAEITDACGYPQNLGYDEIIGTSMASPHVAGQAALLSALGCNVTEITTLITSTARHPFLDVRGVFTPVYGNGIVDAEAAVAGAAEECANVAPVATDDTGSTSSGKLVKIEVLSNDTDADSDILKVASFSRPKNGRVARNSDGSLRYRSRPRFTGTDTFTYVASDRRGGKDRALVTVTVGSG